MDLNKIRKDINSMSEEEAKDMLYITYEDSLNNNDNETYVLVKWPES